MTYSVWPKGCECQAVRAPGSKATRVETIRAGASAAMIGSCKTVPVKYSFGARRVGREPARWISMAVPPFDRRCAGSPRLFLCGRITGLGFGIHRIQPRQYGAVVDLLHDPALHSLLLGAFGQDVVEVRLRDQYGAILVGDDNVVRKYRNAAASDRFAPADECQPCDRGRRREAVAPYGKPGAEHALDIAHDAIGHQRGYPALDHACAQNVAENAGIGDAHGVDHGNAAFRHRLDRGPGRDRRGP